MTERPTVIHTWARQQNFSDGLFWNHFEGTGKLVSPRRTDMRLSRLYSPQIPSCNLYGPWWENSPSSPARRRQPQKKKPHNCCAAPLQTSSVIDHTCLFCYTDCKKDPHWNPWKLKDGNIKEVLQSAPFLSQCGPNCARTNGDIILAGSDTPYPPNWCEWELLAREGFTYRSFRQANCWDEALCRALAAHWSLRGPETLAEMKWPTRHHRRQRGEENEPLNLPFDCD